MARYGRIAQPRNLLRAMQWVAILSEGEARAALRDYRDARDGHGASGLKRWGGGEAVSHFGGPEVVIRRAIAARRVALPLMAQLGPEVTS